MNKIFNFRPLLFSFFALAYGILCGFLQLKYGNLTALYFVLPLIMTAVLSFAAKIFINKITFLNNFFIILDKYKFFSATVLVIFVAGFLFFNISINNFNSYTSLDGKDAFVSGEISDCYYTDNGGYVILENANITTQDGFSYNGRLYVYISGEDNLPQSGKISFNSKITANRIFYDGKINTYYLRNRLHYSFFIGENDYTLSSGNPSFFLNIKRHIKNLLYSNLREQNAGMSYALITGDSLLMDNDIKQAFRHSGIAHIFSVSGLHVGILSAAVIFLLNKLKIKKIHQVFITATFMFFYSGVCNFSPSVVRASLMTVIFLISKAFGCKYDILSSMSATAFLILLFRPLMLFDAGFLLSFAAVSGIILLYSPLKKLFRFLPEKFASLLGLSFAAQLAIIPLSAAFFGYIPVASIFLNIIIIPLISIAYIFLFGICVLSFLPFVTYIFFIVQGILELIKTLILITSSLNITSISSNGFGIGILFYYITLILISEFIFLKKKVKSFSALVFALLFTVSVISFNSPDFSKSSFSALNIRNMQASLITVNGKVYYIDYGSSKRNISYFKEYLKNNNITSIEAAFFTDYTVAAELMPYFSGFNVNKFVMPFDTAFPHLYAIYEADNKVKYLLSGEVYTYESISFSAYYFNGKSYGAVAKTEDFNILYISNYSEISLNYIAAKYQGKAHAVLSGGAISYIKETYNPAAIITSQYIENQKNNIYSTAAAGSLIFYIKNDKIIKYSY